MGSVVAAVAGAALPAAAPPPSKLAVDPNISEGEVAAVEHAVALVVVGIAIVPVTPVGTGLTPGEVISVAPSGIPVGEPAEPIATPSGEVAPMIGVGVTVPSNWPSTCAMATLLTNSAGTTAAINEYLIGALRLQTASPRRALMSTSLATISLGAKLSDIGQSLVIALRCQRWLTELPKTQQGQMFSFLFSASSSFSCFASNVESLSCTASFAAEFGEKSLGRG
jgi:hypothetical protein